MSKKRNKKSLKMNTIGKHKKPVRVFQPAPTPSNLDIREQAKKLALEIKQTHSSVERVFWFPDDSELRIVEIDTNTIESPTNEIEPFYFDSSVSLPVPAGIAIIRPEEYGKLLLPEDWGDWKDAQELEV
jgi:hypothetical protein